MWKFFVNSLVNSNVPDFSTVVLVFYNFQNQGELSFTSSSSECILHWTKFRGVCVCVCFLSSSFEICDKTRLNFLVSLLFWCGFFDINRIDLNERLHVHRKKSHGIASVFIVTSVYVCAQSLSHVWFFVTPWTVAYQAPLSMELSRQEYWSGLPFPTPEDLPNSGIKRMSPASAVSPALGGGSLPNLGSPGCDHWLHSCQVTSVDSVRPCGL